MVRVLSTTTRPEAASSSTTSVKVPPMSTASRQSRAHDDPCRHAGRRVGRCRLAVRGGANTSRIHTSSNSSSPMKTLSPCQTVGRGQVHVAGAQHPAGLVVGIADAEVERAAHDDAELLVGVVVVQERALAPPSMRQNHISRCSPMITRRRKPGRSVSYERVVVEEVAVLVGVGSTRLLTAAAPPCAARHRRGAPPPRPRPCGCGPSRAPRRWPGGPRWTSR